MSRRPPSFAPSFQPTAPAALPEVGGFATTAPPPLPTPVPVPVPMAAGPGQALALPGAGLFRPEALRAHMGPRDGQVLLRPLVGSGWLTLAALAAAIAVVALLGLGSYTRRATVVGHLAPAQGLLRLVAPQPAWVVEQHVQQGQKVKAGEVLFVLSTDRPTVGGDDYQRQVSESLQRRSGQLADAQRRMRESAEAERQALQQRAATLEAERPHLLAQLAEQRRRLKLAEEQQRTWAGLYAERIVTREQLLQRESDLSDQRSRAQALQREQLSLERELGQVRSQLTAIDTRLNEQLEAAQREGEQLRQQLAEAEARRRIVITAPREGTLSLVNATPGMNVDTARPLAQLVPADDVLVAQLYATSRDVGFVQPGTAIWLRYQAFPYERYGMQSAEVLSVSATPASGDELSSWSGVAVGGPQALGGGEPLYRISARLKPEGFPARGGPVALKPGLKLEADLLFERRRLYEWLLLPALQVTQRMGG